MTDDEIRDALKILRQRAAGKGLLRMSEGRVLEVLDLIIDTEVMLLGDAHHARPRDEIVAQIERELQVR